MGKFQQNYKRSKSFFGMLLCLVFVALPLDSKYFGQLVPPGLEETPWAFWGLLVVGSVGSLGFAWQLVCPPLMLAADEDGITLGFTTPSTEINLSLRNFGIRRKGERNPTVSWDQVRSIRVGEVVYCSGDSSTFKKELALRIEFDNSVDMGHCGDMLAIQAGTEAYFAARASKSYEGLTSWKEPCGGKVNENIVLIGKQHFHEEIQLVTIRLQTMMGQFSPHRTADPPSLKE
ncbi:MAG: hypothetical protein GXP26_05615 [Planctomycetes bacterium]|nr:hypothetical protein [Planctomycetota bacterium]